MTSPVNSAFAAWTHGLDSHKARISIFEHIRDIPYSLAVPMSDPGTAPEQLLNLGHGYCVPKHYLLAAMYRNLGIDVVFATFAFSWNDPDLQFPPELRELATSLPVAHHLACRVRINGRWVLVDATWDRPLVKAGFPVNECWDGFADTKCAVKPLRSAIRTAFCRTVTNKPCREREEAKFSPLDGETDHREERDRAGYHYGKTLMRTPEEIARITRFYRKFEAWLVSVRK